MSLWIPHSVTIMSSILPLLTPSFILSERGWPSLKHLLKCLRATFLQWNHSSKCPLNAWIMFYCFFFFFFQFSLMCAMWYWHILSCYLRSHECLFFYLLYKCQQCKQLYMIPTLFRISISFQSICCHLFIHLCCIECIHLCIFMCLNVCQTLHSHYMDNGHYIATEYVYVPSSVYHSFCRMSSGDISVSLFVEIQLHMCVMLLCCQACWDLRLHSVCDGVLLCALPSGYLCVHMEKDESMGTTLILTWVPNSRIQRQDEEALRYITPESSPVRRNAHRRLRR